MKKILSVKLDDGTTAIVSDLPALKRFVDIETLREGLRQLAADTSIDWPAARKLHENRQRGKLEKRATNRSNAKGPRNAFAKRPDAKQVLLADRYDYEARHANAWGWVNSARTKFSIDPKTLRSILNRPE